MLKDENILEDEIIEFSGHSLIPEDIEVEEFEYFLEIYGLTLMIIFIAEYLSPSGEVLKSSEENTNENSDSNINDNTTHKNNNVEYSCWYRGFLNENIVKTAPTPPEKSDVYRVLLWEISSGRPPFYVKGVEYEVTLAIEILQRPREECRDNETSEPENRPDMNNIADVLNAIHTKQKY
ncbi:10875_t:CDS:2 [Funneliformis geosporum]|nr:10875_t:CDS:2 [Funneliformis geosporum]